mmetsp:Transcript_2949/g.7537  ORF Transcript_2949/g.7537 Transcript_2949/m.7537 type:complete len:244 (+) Transcript_2949:1579-2310(+)
MPLVVQPLPLVLLLPIAVVHQHPVAIPAAVCPHAVVRHDRAVVLDLVRVHHHHELPLAMPVPVHHLPVIDVAPGPLHHALAPHPALHKRPLERHPALKLERAHPVHQPPLPHAVVRAPVDELGLALAREAPLLVLFPRILLHLEHHWCHLGLGGERQRVPHHVELGNSRRIAHVHVLECVIGPARVLRPFCLLCPERPDDHPGLPPPGSPLKLQRGLAVLLPVLPHPRGRLLCRLRFRHSPVS